MWWEDIIWRFSAYIFEMFSIWSCHFCHFGVDLIVTVSRETLWTCIGSCEKLFPLCFSSELLGLEGAPAWVRSRWRSVGLLNAEWIMWHVGEKRLKSSNVFVADGDSAQDGSDFSWDDYLEETGALSVPHHAFKHVGASSKSSAAVRNKWLCDTPVKLFLSWK